MAAAALESLKVVEAAPVGAAEEAADAAALVALATTPLEELEELVGALEEASLEEAALEELIMVELAAELEAAELEAAEELLRTRYCQHGVEAHLEAADLRSSGRGSIARDGKGDSLGGAALLRVRGSGLPEDRRNQLANAYSSMRFEAY